MVVAKQNYEDLRKQRVEENKRKMEELSLPQLAQSLKTAHSPKPSLTKRRAIGTEMVEVRRSSRLRDLPAPVYKEIVVYEIALPRSGRRVRYSRKDSLNPVYASDEAREHAINKAEELESKLEGGHPSFVKTMIQSHVTGGCMGLPSHFYRNNLPKNDGTVTLIDEDGEEFTTIYLVNLVQCSAGLSSGWRDFSISHELVDGDALVFHLIEPTVFKVYIIRNKDYYAEGENNEGSDA